MEEDLLSLYAPTSDEQNTVLPPTTVAKEKMVAFIAQHSQQVDDGQKFLDLLNQKPDMDPVFCRLFNIQPLPKG